MNIVRGLVYWNSCINDGMKLLNKLEKDINFSPSIKLRGVLSNNSKYKIFILKGNIKSVKIIIDIMNEKGKKIRKIFEVSRMSQFLNTYSVEFNDELYILRFNVDDFEEFYNAQRSAILGTVNSNYLNELIVWYDFNNEQHLVECLYLFLKNSVLISNKTYDLLRDKLEYFGYDKDYMLQIEYVSKLNIKETQTNEIYKLRLFSETLFELIENTFIHQYDYRYNVNEAKYVYQKYLDTL